MNPYAILVGLLVLAWAGDALVRPTGRRALGLSSGAEFLLAGILIGPLGVAAVTRETLDALAPLTLVAASWLALLVGSQLGYAGERRVPRARLLIGLALGLAVFALCAALGWWLVPQVLALHGDERLFVALGLGCAGSETARGAVVWGAERPGARGPLHDALADLAEADDVVPLAGLALLFALAPQPAGAALRGAPLAALGVTLALGVVLGALAATLTRIEARRTERWGILLGAALLATGLAAQLGLAAPAVLFVMGVALNLLARDGARLRKMLATTTRPVLLPVVALAGAHLDLRDGLALWLALALVPLARLAVKLPALALLREHLAPPARPSWWLGLALMGSGPVTACVGLVVAARFAGPVGRLVLGAAVASIAVGELLGAPALRRQLERAGEWQPPTPDPAPGAPASPPRS